jgi:hypothetical protein
MKLKSELKENVDYEVLTSGENETKIYVKALTGSYKDIILYYDNVSVSEVEDNPTLSFDYHIMNPLVMPENVDQEIFEQYIGDLLNQLIFDGLNEGSLQLNVGEPEQDYPTITLDE